MISSFQINTEWDTRRPSPRHARSVSPSMRMERRQRRTICSCLSQQIRHRSKVPQSEPVVETQTYSAGSTAPRNKRHETSTEHERDKHSRIAERQSIVPYFHEPFIFTAMMRLRVMIESGEESSDGPTTSSVVDRIPWVEYDRLVHLSTTQLCISIPAIAVNHSKSSTIFIKERYPVEDILMVHLIRHKKKKTQHSLYGNASDRQSRHAASETNVEVMVQVFLRQSLVHWRRLNEEINSTCRCFYFSLESQGIRFLKALRSHPLFVGTYMVDDLAYHRDKAKTTTTTDTTTTTPTTTPPISTTLLETLLLGNKAAASTSIMTPIPHTLSLGAPLHYADHQPTSDALEPEFPQRMEVRTAAAEVNVTSAGNTAVMKGDQQSNAASSDYETTPGGPMVENEGEAPPETALQDVLEKVHHPSRCVNNAIANMETDVPYATTRDIIISRADNASVGGGEEGHAGGFDWTSRSSTPDSSSPTKEGSFATCPDVTLPRSSDGLSAESVTSHCAASLACRKLPGLEDKQRVRQHLKGNDACVDACDNSIPVESFHTLRPASVQHDTDAVPVRIFSGGEEEASDVKEEPDAAMRLPTTASCTSSTTETEKVNQNGTGGALHGHGASSASPYGSSRSSSCSCSLTVSRAFPSSGGNNESSSKGSAQIGWERVNQGTNTVCVDDDPLDRCPQHVNNSVSSSKGGRSRRSVGLSPLRRNCTDERNGKGVCGGMKRSILMARLEEQHARIVALREVLMDTCITKQ